MDSCHIFNFLFGTKRATTELSKCFSSVVNSSGRSSTKTRTSKQERPAKSDDGEDSSRCRGGVEGEEVPQANSAPLSPLKQLQMKIASLAPGSAKGKSSSEKKNTVSISCDAKCGTYRATLVRLQKDQDEDRDQDQNQNQNQESHFRDNQQQIVVKAQQNKETKVSTNTPCVGQELKIVGNPIDSVKRTNKLDANNNIIVFQEGKNKAEMKIGLEQDESLDIGANFVQQTQVYSYPEDSINNINGSSKTNQPTKVQQQQARCKRVVLYDDCELKQDRHRMQEREQEEEQQQLLQQQCQGQLAKEPQQRRQIVASAEVYNMVVGDSREKRAGLSELRRVGSFVSDNQDKDQVEANSQLVNTSYNGIPNPSDTQNGYDNTRKRCESLRDKRSVYVQSLVQSLELNGRFEATLEDSIEGGDVSEREKKEEEEEGVGRRDYDRSVEALRTQTSINYTNSNSYDVNEQQPYRVEQLPMQTRDRQQQNILNKQTSTVSVSNFTKPVTFVKPLPPKTPPKSNKAKCLNMQISLNKPTKIQHLFQDENFLVHFFDKLEPLDRCVAAQVCRKWRDILYANQNYWKDLINVIDCTQLRREHLVECILNTLQSAKLKQQQQQQHKAIETKDQSAPSQRYSTARTVIRSQSRPEQGSALIQSNGRVNRHTIEVGSDSSSDSFINHQQSAPNTNAGYMNNQSSFFDFDQEDVWRIQELCNRYTQRGNISTSNRQQQQQLMNCNSTDSNGNQSQNASEMQQQQQQTCSTSKSSSIPSQISSTLSSVSLSSLLSPLSESSRIESVKEKLYTSLDNRGFEAICLFGATDDDIDDLVCKMPIGAHKRITCARLSNCCLTNRGLDSFISTFNQIEEIELSGCNEITNSFDLKTLTNLKRLIITDCINIADGVAQKLIQIMHQLDELTIQAYHLTDAFIEYLSLNSDTTRLKRLELPNCKEITNQSIITIAKYFPRLEVLSISGSTKITDNGIEILAERARGLKSLDLSWCSRITDASLECIACDLGDTLTDLILDRNVHITDIGLGYLATMSKLTLLHIRWCPRVTDAGLESIIAQVKSLKYLSLAGIHQITARSLLCLVEADSLEEIELTNCPAVNADLLLFLSTRLPKCNIIF